MRLKELKALKEGDVVVVKQGRYEELDLAGYDEEAIEPVIGKEVTVITTFMDRYGAVEVSHPDFPNGSYCLSQSWLEFPKKKAKQEVSDVYIAIYFGECSATFNVPSELTAVCNDSFALSVTDVVNEIKSENLEIFKLSKVQATVVIPDPEVKFE